jgi:bacterioferritin (cytochrome b1)
MTKQTVSTEVLANDLKYLKQGIDDIKEELKCIKDEKVSRERFDLVNEEQNNRIKKVENLIFGTIALTLTSIGKLLLDLIIK